jgi:putative ABC transport system permease protein
MILLIIFAGVALLLATTGIYSVLAFTVQQRTHEIGIRMALGANSFEVLGMVVKQGMRLAFVGVVLGLAGSSALSGLMEGLLFGVEQLDPATLAAVAAALSGASLLAVYVPARRARRVDPMQAFRSE